MRLITATIVTTTLAMTPLVDADNEPVQRLGAAAAVFSEIMAAPDKGIPQDLLEKAHCIVIVPDLKTAAFVFGGKYGKGYLSCRNKSGAGWSAPGTVRIEGGSVGFQIGGSSTDLIMLVMTERGSQKLLESKFTLGAEGSVAAGRWDAPRRPRRTRSYTRTSFRGRDRRGCLPVSPCKGRRCVKTSTTTPRSMASGWKIATS